MISIFNGRKRSLGKGGREDYYLQMSVEFRQHLHLLKGPKLAIFMCIALHADKDGWAFPSVKTITKETGYGRDAIFDNLKEMEDVRIGGHRILLRYQPRSKDGEFDSNRYLIFPSDEEVSRYGDSPSRSKADTDENRVGPKPTHEEEPVPLKDNHVVKEEPHTHKEGSAGARVGVIGGGSQGKAAAEQQGSRFTMEECRRYADHLKQTGQGITNPGGYSTKIFRSGEADAFIDAFLKTPAQADPAKCPDCRGTGHVYVDPKNFDKGVRPCRHQSLQAGAQ
jgi:hypothetical protein